MLEAALQESAGFRQDHAGRTWLPVRPIIPANQSAQSVRPVDPSRQIRYNRRGNAPDAKSVIIHL